MSDRQLLRKQLQCKSFEWYLENVWPENFFPSTKRFFGKILIVQEDAPLYKNYLEIIKEADPKMSSNLTYVISFLNSHMEQFEKLLLQVPVLCLKQPQNQNSPKALPYGMAWIGECIDKTFMDEMFVIREDGHVSNCKTSFTKIQCGHGENAWLEEEKSTKWMNFVPLFRSNGVYFKLFSFSFSFQTDNG